MKGKNKEGAAKGIKHREPDGRLPSRQDRQALIAENKYDTNGGDTP